MTLGVFDHFLGAFFPATFAGEFCFSGSYFLTWRLTGEGAGVSLGRRFSRTGDATTFNVFFLDLGLASRLLVPSSRVNHPFF